MFGLGHGVPEIMDGLLGQSSRDLQDRGNTSNRNFNLRYTALNFLFLYFINFFVGTMKEACRCDVVVEPQSPNHPASGYRPSRTKVSMQNTEKNQMPFVSTNLRVFGPHPTLYTLNSLWPSGF